MEDDLSNNFTSPHFPDACATPTQPPPLLLQAPIAQSITVAKLHPAGPAIATATAKCDLATY